MKLTILSFLFLLLSMPAMAQQSVKGKVTDAEGPIAGATVVVKGGTQRTITNATGDYTINNVKSSDILVFSYIGFLPLERMVLDQSVINVRLIMDEVRIEEVAVGYEVIRREDLTGAVSSINPDDLASTATANFDEALAGRVAGVDVTTTDGTPGSPMNIVIRGGNSITGDNSPLYVVDGVPLEDFDPSSINTRDIKSFDILKDASATAIYGSRGANGVIVITTLGGRDDGKTEIKASTATWVRTIPNRIEVMSPYEYVQYQQKIAYANDNYVPGTNLGVFYRLWIDPELYRDAKGTNWQDEIFQTGLTKNHTLSLRAGNKQTSISYSGNYLDQDGTMITTGFKKINNLLRVTHKIVDNLEVDARLEYSRIDGWGQNVSGNQYTSVIRDALSFRPIQPVNWTAEDESDYLDEILANDPYLYDPVKALENTNRTRLNDVLGGTLGLRYKFLKKFNLSLMGNYRANINETTLFYMAETQEAARTNRGINGQINNTRQDLLSTSNVLRYNDRKGKHVYGGLLGFEAQQTDYKSSTLRNTNIPTDQFGIYNLGIATTSTLAQTSYSKNTLASFFSRVNYTYANRYLATVNFRADASSKFRKENRWGYFPSLALAWRVSNEKFMKGKDITDMKVRAGWGKTGNNRIGDFVAYNLFAVNSSSGYVLGDDQSYVPGAYQSNMAVPDLRWETTVQSNFGVDLQWKKRIDLTMDYYIKNTVDLLLDADMAPHTGFDRVQQNVGEVSNRGLEFTVNSRNIQNRNFRWDTNFNITFNRTKTIRLNDGQERLLTDPNWDNNFMQTEYQYITQVGQPVGMMYGMVFDRIYQLEDFNVSSDGEYVLKDGIAGYANIMRPGMVKFKDLNGDGTINAEDRAIIGNPHPKHIGGLMNTFRYKAFDLQVMFQWAYDFDILNGTKSQLGSVFRQTRNGLKSLNDIWTPTNVDTDIGGMRYDTRNLTVPFGYKLDSRHIDDGSYLRFKTLVLGYNIQNRWLDKYSIKGCRLSVSAQNLYTWTKYEGYDPDVSVGRFGALTPRLDYSAYPQSRTISGQIQLTF